MVRYPFSMSLFSRKRKVEGEAPRRSQREAQAATMAHFEDFVKTRVGVESYFEPETPREQAALLLSARDGEWTRRRVPDIGAAAKLANELGIPFYEVVKTGYPDSMRQWNLRQQRR